MIIRQAGGLNETSGKAGSRLNARNARNARNAKNAGKILNPNIVIPVVLSLGVLGVLGAKPM